MAAEEFSSNVFESDRRKKVIFDTIEIHEHPYELGDNPSVSDGVPLTISWHCQSKIVFELDYYEIYRPSSERKSKQNLRLSVPERAHL